MHKPKKVADLDAMYDELQTARENFLRSRGWAYTSNHPGCLWLYEKEINGSKMVCDAGTAMHIERSVDEDAEFEQMQNEEWQHHNGCCRKCGSADAVCVRERESDDGTWDEYHCSACEANWTIDGIDS